jgi:PIN domain nuclease of toxin-antitoxin system
VDGGAMILLDTHVWIWWVHDEERLSQEQLQAIRDHESEGLGISAISCWEIAKLVEKRKLSLPVEIEQWFERALSYPGIQLLPITPDVAITSTRFPGDFSQDPADQLIAATALVLNCPLITSDNKLRSYSLLTTI